MLSARWLQISDAGSYARRILNEEAPEIPTDLVENGSWTQETMSPADLLVDESMVARHDDDPLHQDRRDGFSQAILSGEELPPLIAIGPDRHLVDGYARLRAVRQLEINEVSVIVQSR